MYSWSGKPHNWPTARTGPPLDGWWNRSKSIPTLVVSIRNLFLRWEWRCQQRERCLCVVLVVEVVLVLVDSITTARGFRRIAVMVLLVVVIVFVYVLVAHRRTIRGFSTAAFSASRTVGTGGGDRNTRLGNTTSQPIKLTRSLISCSSSWCSWCRRRRVKDCLLLIALLVGVWTYAKKEM